MSRINNDRNHDQGQEHGVEMTKILMRILEMTNIMTKRPACIRLGSVLRICCGAPGNHDRCTIILTRTKFQSYGVLVADLLQDVDGHVEVVVLHR